MSRKLSLEGFWGVRIKKRFPETITHEIFETKSRFHLNGKSLVSVFPVFSASIKKNSIWQEDCAPAYHSMEFRQFPYIS